MDEAELDELERLANAATPGPWLNGIGEMEILSAGVFTQEATSNNHLVNRQKQVVSGCGCCGSPFGDNAANDRPFIIAVRDALPKLIAEIRRLRAKGE